MGLNISAGGLLLIDLLAIFTIVAMMIAYSIVPGGSTWNYILFFCGIASVCCLVARCFR